VDQEVLTDLRMRLEQTRLAKPGGNPAANDGISVEYMTELVAYWHNTFDWEAQERSLNRWRHFRTTIDGVRLHFIHEPGRGPHPLPIIVTHGWPGSFAEMQKIIPLLTDPASHGGDESDSFDVVVPSLPGFGFSELPVDRHGLNAFEIADIWNQLMHRLGYRRFGAQGGDFGASINTAIGLRHPASLIGIHLNYIPGSLMPFLGVGSAPLTEQERAFQRDAAAWYDTDGAYAHVQRTRPRTLAYGLEDSPVGLAAWIVEKFAEWGDCAGRIESRFTKDELLSNVMVYWATRTAYSASRLYVEMRDQPLTFGSRDYIDVPCGIARLPLERPFPPRESVERSYRVVQWTEFPSGGHFAAMEEPVRLVEDIRTFFRPLRGPTGYART
jgi:pimeloyl-ACP methyl ester carboxylesterase